MLLTEVSKYIKCKKVYNPKKKIFNSIFTNSQNIKKNSIFIFDNKKEFSQKYIKQALDKGAVAIVTNQYIKNVYVTQFIVEKINLSLYNILNLLKPHKPLNSISITGTNGKTSVVWYISQISYLNKILTKTYGTLGYYINTKKMKNSNLTTPEFDVLYQLAFLNKKNRYNFIHESSSHAIKQNRLKIFPINIAALTNITHDHLDYHKSFTEYRNVKFRLFTKYLDKDGYAILNDRINKIDILKQKLKSNKIITYGLKKSDIFLYISKNQLRLKFFKRNYKIKLITFSAIELENMSCAIACCYCLQININNIIKILKKVINPPGRLEKIKNKNNTFKVFIDYAHTPDALKKILLSQTVNKNKPNILFGCGGDRDKDKRLKMGSIANKYANKIYITDDNPRNENPSLIRNEILSSCAKGIEIPNREKAIIKAIKDLNKKDTLIIAGKGHEKFQLIKDSLKKFDDLKIAKRELDKK